MSCQRSSSRISVPEDLREILLEFTISYLLEQPGDIIDYAVDFFTKLRQNRLNTLPTEQAPTTPDEQLEDGNVLFYYFSITFQTSQL